MTTILALSFTLYLIISLAVFFHLKNKIQKASLEENKISQALQDNMDSAKDEKNKALAILNSMAEAVAVIGIDQKLTLVNPAFCQITSEEPQHLEGRYYWEVFRDSSLNQMIEKSIATQSPIQKEHSILLSEAIFQIQASPVFSQGHFEGVVLIFYDITKLRQLEKMRTEFVANVSHELKTPLTSIMGYVETLQEGAIDDENNRLKFLEIIQDHAQKLYQLIEDLLHLSKIESLRETLDRKEIALDVFAQKIKESFAPKLKNKKIKLDFEFSHKPFNILAEPKSIEELLINLIDNAIKYNVENGQIFLKAWSQDKNLFIEVKDTGIGILEADIPRIFERFYRVDKSRSKETGGSGLGLSIAKHIVQRHGGNIQVTSTLGKGSTFTITLPGAINP